MTILVPVSSDKQMESEITNIDDSSLWAFIILDEGKIKSLNFYENNNEIDEWVDTLVVTNKDQDVEEFLDNGILVLTAPFQETLEDIVEAFLFKDLHDYLDEQEQTLH